MKRPYVVGISMQPSHARNLIVHLARVVVRALVATGLLWLAVSFPLPLMTSQLFVSVRMPVAIFLFIVYIGKLLIDTFFFDHYA
jgi:hypothetical protein